MSTITAILCPSADGTLHLPLPDGWEPQQPVKVQAVLEPVEEDPEKTAQAASLKGFGRLRGMVWMAPDFDEPLKDFADYSS